MNGYKPGDIDVVAAFDIDRRKVGQDVHEAILPNPTARRFSILIFPNPVYRFGWVKFWMGLRAICRIILKIILSLCPRSRS
jgi:hypothetical protein